MKKRILISIFVCLLAGVISVSAADNKKRKREEDDTTAKEAYPKTPDRPKRTREQQLRRVEDISRQRRAAEIRGDLDGFVPSDAEESNIEGVSETT
ncbi:hypothetical protein HN446_00325 [bacterium]|nr:hypothetical protein [bacterium]